MSSTDHRLEEALVHGALPFTLVEAAAVTSQDVWRVLVRKVPARTRQSVTAVHDTRDRITNRRRGHAVTSEAPP